MAVQNNLQGKGIGASMMHFAENVARDAGYKNLIMHARKTAIGFYEKLGYKVSGNEFIELSIPHCILWRKSSLHFRLGMQVSDFKLYLQKLRGPS